MKRTFSALVGLGVSAAIAALAIAGPFPDSGGGSGFTDYRQAAADQYCQDPGGCTTGNATSGTTNGNATSGTTNGNATSGATNGNATIARSGTAPERASGGVGAGGARTGVAAAGATGTGTGTTLAQQAADGACVPYLYFYRPVSRATVGAVTKALALISLPAPHVVRLTEPMDVDAVAKHFGVRSSKSIAGDSKRERSLGEQTGAQVTAPRTLINAVDPVLFNDVKIASGKLHFYDAAGPFTRACVVVLARKPATGDKQVRKTRNNFEAGFVKGLIASRAPLAAVELTKTKPSQIKWFKSHHVSSVDNVDTADGQKALSLLLQGASGTYGVKSTAQALIPEPVAVRTLESGTPLGPRNLTFWILILFGLVAARFTIAAGWRLRRARVDADGRD
jgi:hypothetical protein